MTKKDLAKYFGVEERTISNWMNKGLPYKSEKRGLSYRITFDLKEVEKWMLQQK